jgi:hypothetical protein
VAADPGFFSAANESKAEQMGVIRVAIPSHDTKSPARKQRQKQRWFKKLQKWRAAVKAASAFSNAGMGCAGHSIKDRPASGAGSDSE